jgi:tRNA(fMet)-specific endonuclease VapC
MAFLLDTDVALHLRDGDPAITTKVGARDDAILMSIVTRVELEGGVYREPAHAQVRRARLGAILAAIPTVAFDDAAADAYGDIVASVGYSRRKLLDRMIAAPGDGPSFDVGHHQCGRLCRCARTFTSCMVTP